LKLVSTILERDGYEVIPSASAEEAIMKAGQFEGALHLLLTDVIMPGMKGPEVYKRVAEKHPEAKVLYMSGYTANVINRQGLLDEDVNFIQKPFSKKTLREKMLRILSK